MRERSRGKGFGVVRRGKAGERGKEVDVNVENEDTIGRKSGGRDNAKAWR